MGLYRALVWELIPDEDVQLAIVFSDNVLTLIPITTETTMTMRAPPIRYSSITPTALIAGAGRAALVQRPARPPPSPSVTTRCLGVAEAPPNFAGWQSWRCGHTIASADRPARPPGCPVRAPARPLRRWPSATRSPSSAVAAHSNSHPRWSFSTTAGSASPTPALG